jgi:hypothetical protein
MGRAGRQLKGSFTFALLVVLAACGRPAADAPAAPAPDPPRSTSSPPAAPAPAQGAPRSVTEGTSATAPLGVRVDAIRRESTDSVRVELTLANLAPAAEWRPGSPAAASIQAAVEALEGLSLLSADGRRRMFPLHGGTGQRVGPAVPAPAPGKPERFWALFPAADGPVSLLLPGFAPLSGLAVAPSPGRPEP